MEQQTEMHAIMEGRVQGVGFRATTYYYAKRLGLVGTVKNLIDGRVEIYAQGSHVQLLELIRLLKENAIFKPVDSHLLEFNSITTPFSGFHIIR